jgi:hypothetical protein
MWMQCFLNGSIPDNYFTFFKISFYIHEKLLQFARSLLDTWLTGFLIINPSHKILSKDNKNLSF